MTDDLLRAAEELADAAEVAWEDFGDDALDALFRAVQNFRRAQQREIAARIEMHFAVKTRVARMPVDRSADPDPAER